MSTTALIGNLGFAAMLTVVVTGLKWNFDEELAFYGRLFRAFQSFSEPPPLATIFVRPFDVVGHRITWASAVLLVYVVYYSKLDPNGGGAIFSFVLVGGYVVAYKMVSEEIQYNKAAKEKGAGKAVDARPWHKVPWKVGFALHAVAWYMQIHPGHGMAEGVKPALVDSLAQALGVAPLFAFYEGLWFAGFAPDLKAHVNELVTVQRAAMCDVDPTYPWCTT
eukprot:gene829-488_t